MSKGAVIRLVLVTPALLTRLPKESVADKELSALLAGNQLVPIVHKRRMKLSAMSAPCSPPEAAWTLPKIQWRWLRQKSPSGSRSSSIVHTGSPFRCGCSEKCALTLRSTRSASGRPVGSNVSVRFWLPLLTARRGHLRVSIIRHKVGIHPHRQRGVTRQDAPTAVARRNCDMTFPAVITAVGDIGQLLAASASATQVLQV